VKYVRLEVRAGEPQAILATMCVRGCINGWLRTMAIENRIIGGSD
jgi:hypothetical protein